MSVLRTVGQPMLRQFARQTPTVAFTSRRAASQDYGSGAGNPAGENPQDQPKNPMEHKEHPGPPAPSVGNNNPSSKQGSGGEQQQGGQQQSSPDKKDSSKGTQGAQPKIFNETPPAKGEASEEVEQHNREMDSRADKAHKGASDEDVKKDKVGKEFWSGTGGANRQP
ncbi:hypothetical protein LTR08_008470 [Meristemomyces frigidus]|nr:hypothetical protein LTR08_008470 [Meristemomyces frigidus]